MNTRQQRIARRNPKLKRSYNWFGLALALFIFLVLGTVGHLDQQQAKQDQAEWTCQHQLYETTPTYQQCISNQLERNSDR